MAGNDKSEDGQQMGYLETFRDPRTSRAGYTACLLAVFQQLTGINAIIFYSSTIFANAGTFSANQGSAIVYTANMVATMGSVVLLSIAGRKTLMLINQLGCIVCLAVMWIATMNGNANLELIMIICFVCVFEFGPGPVVWLYISEICNDKSASVATTVN